MSIGFDLHTLVFLLPMLLQFPPQSRYEPQLNAAFNLGLWQHLSAEKYRVGLQSKQDMSARRQAALPTILSLQKMQCSCGDTQVAPKSDPEEEAVTPLLEVELRLEAPALIFHPALPLPTPTEMDDTMEDDENAAAEAALQLAASSGKAATSVVIAFQSWLDGFAAIGGLVPLLDGSEGGVSSPLLSSFPHSLPQLQPPNCNTYKQLHGRFIMAQECVFNCKTRNHSLLGTNLRSASLLLLSAALQSALIWLMAACCLHHGTTPCPWQCMSHEYVACPLKNYELNYFAPLSLNHKRCVVSLQKPPNLGVSNYTFFEIVVAFDHMILLPCR